jgi:FKBP-type peptidyl-prolyl cis-trans isomerase FkpA
MKKGFFFLVLLLLLFSCSRYPGYRQLTSDIYFKLIEFDEGDKKVFPGDYVTIIIEYRTSADSLFFSGVRKVKVSKPREVSSLDNCFLRLSSGDSASFIMPASAFFNNTLNTGLPRFLKEGDHIKINIRMLDVQSEKEFQSEKKMFLAWSDELSEYENIILKKFMIEENPGIRPCTGGFYFIVLKKGNLRKIIKGDHIWVHYEGKFLNGKYFDGTYRSSEPVDFIYGTQFVLIQGLEDALAYMTEGEKAMVILPSGLAFGENGDQSGIIPPYSSLIYTLEVLRIE